MCSWELADTTEGLSPMTEVGTDDLQGHFLSQSHAKHGVPEPRIWTLCLCTTLLLS